MATIRLTGYISETGELKVDLPRGLPAGAVEVTIDLPAEQRTDEEHTPITEAEIAEMLRVEPKTGAEIVKLLEAGLIGEGWSDVTVSGAEWVEEQRRQRGAANQW